MSYIGAEPTTAAFPFDQFSGNGTTTAFTLTYAPASTTSIIVAISGVVQNPNLYSVIGTTITFSPAPPTGTNNISVLYLGLPVIGVSNPGNTAYFSSTSFTATGGQTTFTPSGSYTPGFINVIRNGAQLAPANYTATNGTTVVLANACTAGDTIVIEVFTLTSISNALPLTGGTVTGQSTFNSGVNLAVSSGNVGIGTTTVRAQTHVFGPGQTTANLTDAGNRGGMLRVSDWSTNAGNGGAVLFANVQGDIANSVGFAAIKGILVDGSNNTSGDLAFSTRTVSTDTALAERMRITTAGNVGIGTTSPVGRLRVSGADSPQIALVNGASYGVRIGSLANLGGYVEGVDAGGVTSYQPLIIGGSILQFTTNGTERARIDSSGNFLFNSGYGSVATAFGCRAWVNFNGTANTNLSGTYSQSGTTVTVTATAHGLIVGNSIYSDITTGTAVDGVYTVATVPTADTFTYTAGTSLTTSGNITLIRSTIRASGNVSSITDNGTGLYTVNFTNAMPDANYSAQVVPEDPGNTNPVIGGGYSGSTRTTSAYQLQTVIRNVSTAILYDPSFVNVAIFR